MTLLGRRLRERYTLLERLGSGRVYKALDRYRAALPEAQRYVALKILHAGESCSEETIADLRRALHPAQSLSHRNIVNFHEFDRDGDVVFYTMELLDGEPLNRVIERLRPARMQATQAWTLIRQVGAALEHAHERGVVHGSLSPHNIWVTPDGGLRVLNFGSAGGTAAYASCEQLDGRPAEAGDDLYALACICSELLTGSHPFESRPATLARDFGVRAIRPPGLDSRQWRALQRGLSWHRGGRAVGVAAWMRQLMRDPTPSRAGAALVAAMLTVALCIPQLWSSSVSKSDAGAAVEPAKPAKRAAAEPTVAEAGPSAPKTPEDKPPVATVKAGPAGISVDSSPVRTGDRFVEVRVRRDQAKQNTTLTWWTETATAKQGVDFEPQSKALQTFPAGGRSTRFYVKLLPNSERSGRDYFYVAVAQSGHHDASGKITRLQIWLPRSRDQLQARR